MIAISFDIDWAPEFMVESIVDRLIEANVKSTWFVTNEGSYLAKMRARPDLFELGIHPNFFPGSSHGSSVPDVISHMKNLVPEAKLSRSHGVFQNGQVLFDLVAIGEIEMDCTMFTYGVPFKKCSTLYTPGGNLQRMPVFWADDHEFNSPTSEWTFNKFLNEQGHMIFSFHPIHVYLNSNSSDHYDKLKKEVHIDQVTEEQAAQFINSQNGSNTMLESILSLTKTKLEFISTLSNN